MWGVNLDLQVLFSHIAGINAVLSFLYFSVVSLLYFSPWDEIVAYCPYLTNLRLFQFLDTRLFSSVVPIN